MVELYLSMAAFALAASITPGPVNLVALGSGARFGWRPSLWHVSGASVGFAVLLLLIGLGLHKMLERLPVLLVFIRFAGVAFFLYMAWQLAADDGVLSPEAEGRRPGFWAGAVMQWLNPKAWLASLASMGLFATEGGVGRIWAFTLLYFLICYLSVASWAWAAVAWDVTCNSRSACGASIACWRCCWWPVPATCWWIERRGTDRGLPPDVS